jgi:transposase
MIRGCLLPSATRKPPVIPPRRRYATDLTDAEWQLLAPLIPRPASQAPGASDRGQGLHQSGQPGGAARPPDPAHHPERGDQKANRARRGAGGGGRPPASDRERYRQRNQVERLMNRGKQFRAVATRFDKLADRYQATITIANIFIWLRARPDQPRGDPRNTP